MQSQSVFDEDVRISGDNLHKCGSSRGDGMTTIDGAEGGFCNFNVIIEDYVTTARRR